jgi:hypothetical protein
MVIRLTKKLDHWQGWGVCFTKATIGSLSNEDNKNVKLRKAGRSRWLGIRPTVRGVAMNLNELPGTNYGEFSIELEHRKESPINCRANPS